MRCVASSRAWELAKFDQHQRAGSRWVWASPRPGPQVVAQAGVLVYIRMGFLSASPKETKKACGPCCIPHFMTLKLLTASPRENKRQWPVSDHKRDVAAADLPISTWLMVEICGARNDVSWLVAAICKSQPHRFPQFCQHAFSVQTVLVSK